MEGAKLIDLLAEISGLPKRTITNQLTNLLEQNGLSASTVTIEQLRPIIAQFAREVIDEQLSGHTYQKSLG